MFELNDIEKAHVRNGMLMHAAINAARRHPVHATEIVEAIRNEQDRLHKIDVSQVCLNQNEIDLILAGKKINAIKKLRERYNNPGIGLTVCKDVVDNYIRDNNPPGYNHLGIYRYTP